jgi:hypothetical protein
LLLFSPKFLPSGFERKFHSCIRQVKL